MDSDFLACTFDEGLVLAPAALAKRDSLNLLFALDMESVQLLKIVETLFLVNPCSGLLPSLGSFISILVYCQMWRFVLCSFLRKWWSGLGPRVKTFTQVQTFQVLQIWPSLAYALAFNRNCCSGLAIAGTAFSFPVIVGHVQYYIFSEMQYSRNYADVSRWV